MSLTISIHLRPFSSKAPDIASPLLDINTSLLGPYLHILFSLLTFGLLLLESLFLKEYVCCVLDSRRLTL